MQTQEELAKEYEKQQQFEKEYEQQQLKKEYEEKTAVNPEAVTPAKNEVLAENRSEEELKQALEKDLFDFNSKPKILMSEQQQKELGQEMVAHNKETVKSMFFPKLKPRKIENYNDDSWTKFTPGFIDSALGMSDDITTGVKGGSGYKTHDESWDSILTGEVFTNKQKAKEVIQDLTYMTGMGLADLPAILGIATLSNITVSPLFATGATFGGYSGLKTALQTKRDTGEVDVGASLGEAAKGFVEGEFFGLGKVAGTGAGQKIISKLAPGATSTLVTKAVPSMLGFTGANAGMTLANVGLSEEELNWKNYKTKFLMNTIPNIVQDAGLSGAVKIKSRMLGSTTQIIDTSIKNRSYSAEEKNIMYGEFADNALKRAEKYKEEGKNISDEAFKDMADHFEKVAQRVAEYPIKANEKVDPYTKLFKNPEAKRQFLGDLLDSLEEKSGVKSELRNEDGSWNEKAEKYLYTTGEIKNKIKKIDNEIGTEKMYEENPDFSGTGNKLVDNIQRLERVILKKRLDEHELPIPKRTVEQRNIFYGETATNFRTKIKETADIQKRLNLSKELTSLINVSSERKRLLEEYIATSAPEIRRIGKAINYVKDAKGKGLKKNYKTTLRLLGMTGEEATRFIYEPSRVGLAIVNEITNENLRDLHNVSKHLSEKEITEASLYAVSIQKKAKYLKDGSVIEEEFGKELLNNLYERDIIKRDQVKDYESLNDNQKAYVDYIMSVYRHGNKLSNLSRELNDLDSIRAMSDYVKLMVEKGDADLSEHDLNKWLTNNALNGKDVNAKYGTFKRKGGDYNFKLNIGEVLAQYISHNNQVAIMSPIAQRIIDLAEVIKKEQPELANDIHAMAKYMAGNYYDVTPGKETINNLTNNVVGATLAASINTIATQFTSLIPAIHQAGLGGILDAIGTITKSKLTPFDNTALMNKLESQNLTYICNDITENQKRLSASNSKAAWLINKGFTPMRMIDFYMREIVYEAIKQNGLKKGFDEQTASYYADQAIAKTQGTGSRIDNSAMQRTAMGKLFLAYQTFSIANLNYIVSDVFGADSMYNLVKKFESESSAKFYADRHKGYEMFELGEGKEKIYGVYEKKKFQTTTALIGKAVMMSIGMGICTTMFHAMNEITPYGVKLFNSPFPELVNALWEDQYGYTFDDWLLGTNRYNEVKSKPLKLPTVKVSKLGKVKIDKGEKDFNPLMAAAITTKELSKQVPIVGSVLNYGSGVGGPITGTANKTGKEFLDTMKSGKVIDAINTVNNTLTLAGNPFYQYVRQTIKVMKAKEQKEKEEEQKLNRLLR